MKGQGIQVERTVREKGTKDTNVRSKKVYAAGNTGGSRFGVQGEAGSPEAG